MMNDFTLLRYECNVRGLFLSALPAVLLVQHLRVNWSRWGELCLASCSLLNALILFWLSQTNSLIVMYAGYIVYRLIYETMITITQ